MAFSIITLSIRDSRHERQSLTTLYHFAECRVLFVVMLSVGMLNAAMLNVIMLRIIMRAAMLNVIMLSVVAPYCKAYCYH
jgi:hypothetical protein